MFAFAGKETVIVGGNHNYPPYEFFDSNGQPAGLMVDLIRAIGDVMGMDVKIKLGEWGKIRQELMDGTIDMTLGINQTEERDKVFDFYFSDRHCPACRIRPAWLPESEIH